MLTPRSEEYSSSDTEDDNSHGRSKGDTTNARIVFQEKNIIEEEALHNRKAAPPVVVLDNGRTASVPVSGWASFIPTCGTPGCARKCYWDRSWCERTSPGWPTTSGIQTQIQTATPARQVVRMRIAETIPKYLHIRFD